jgi:glycogen debranching enzyme
MDEILQVQNDFYILATSKLLDQTSQVLKQGDTFAIFDRAGDVHAMGKGQQGLFHEGTRFLSELRLTLQFSSIAPPGPAIPAGKERPLFLSSTISEDNSVFKIDLTNPDLQRADGISIARGTLHLFRSKFLWQGACYERLRLSNYGLADAEVSMEILVDADFRDIFEVRGTVRKQRGKLLEPQKKADALILGYEGLDGVTRRLHARCSPPATVVTGRGLQFQSRLVVKQEAVIDLCFQCEAGGRPVKSPPMSYDMAAKASAQSALKAHQNDCVIETTNLKMNEWFQRSQSDLHTMITQTDRGPYPYAGIPWFSTVFGRDGIFTAYFSLWMNPDIAKGVLFFLAWSQAKDINPEQDAEPGKILHEMRSGEMAALGEIPFGRYYGSVDSTPLFVMLAGAYYERTGDLAFIKKIWTNIEAALLWMDRYGDRDGDGFVEYLRQTPQGLAQQGWKDSYDSVFHADGTLAEGPIALCEVQAYVYAAKRAASQMAKALGRLEKAAALAVEAARLQKRFEEAYWSEKLSTYVLALDGQKRPCKVRTSNAGHCLFAGIADAGHARRAAKTLLRRESFSGWGIRTLDADEIRYNPMSYHNGSVWPHDNAILAAGFDRYGLKDEAEKVFEAVFRASEWMERHRLPELYCGFHRRNNEGPTLYPVACSPQAWASASAFMLLQSLLGWRLRAVPLEEIRFVSPRLPRSLDEIHLRGILLGRERVSFRLYRKGSVVKVERLDTKKSARSSNLAAK